MKREWNVVDGETSVVQNSANVRGRWKLEKRPLWVSGTCSKCQASCRILVILAIEGGFSFATEWFSEVALALSQIRLTGLTLMDWRTSVLIRVHEVPNPKERNSSADVQKSSFISCRNQRRVLTDSGSIYGSAECQCLGPGVRDLLFRDDLGKKYSVCCEKWTAWKEWRDVTFLAILTSRGSRNSVCARDNIAGDRELVYGWGREGPCG